MIVVKQVLDVMFEEYGRLVKQLGLEETMQNEKDVNIPKKVILMRNCIDMYDQEYMVKVWTGRNWMRFWSLILFCTIQECIRTIVSGEGFATQQHLAGSIALWKSESYLDDALQLEIKQLKQCYGIIVHVYIYIWVYADMGLDEDIDDSMPSCSLEFLLEAELELVGVFAPLVISLLFAKKLP